MASFACDICFNEYDFNDHRPIVGSCGHSICLDCSRRIAGICPQCRERSFNEPRTNFGMLELMENRRIEKERADRENKDLLRAVQVTFDEVEQEKMLLKLSLEEEKRKGQGYSKEGNAAESPREVVLNTDYAESGINVSGRTEDCSPIFINSVEDGSVADGLVRVGDQVLSVNGESLTETTLFEATAALTKAKAPLRLRLLYSTKEVEWLKNQTDELNDGLQKLITYGKNPVEGGLFVRALDFSKFAEKKALEYFYGDILEITHKPQADLWVARKILPNGSKSEKGVIFSSKWQIESTERHSKSVGLEEPVFSYLVVKKHFDKSPRPIVVLGSFKEYIIEVLLILRPNLSKRIKKLSPSEIRKLHQSRVYPIVVFIGPQKISSSKEEDEAEVSELKKDMPLFTMRLYKDRSMEETIALALKHIDEESRPNFWIPSEDQSALLS